MKSWKACGHEVSESCSCGAPNDDDVLRQVWANVLSFYLCQDIDVIAVQRADEAVAFARKVLETRDVLR